MYTKNGLRMFTWKKEVNKFNLKLSDSIKNLMFSILNFYHNIMYFNVAGK